MSANRIDAKLVSQLFKELDEVLKAKGENREITIFGSGAMMAQGFLRKSRVTIDVDMVRPDIDMDLRIIAHDVGEKHKLDMTWLNSAGFIFGRNFPSGWEDRRITVFKGEALTVHSLGRKDLIATKFNALCDRNEAHDVEDLTDMKPTKVELDFAKEWVIGLKGKEPKFLKHVEERYSKVMGSGRGRSI